MTMMKPRKMGKPIMKPGMDMAKDGMKKPTPMAMPMMKKGGMTKHEDMAMDKKVVKKAVKMHDDQLHGGKKTNLSKLCGGGKVKKYEEGGLTFSDMPEEDRAASARAAMDSINARQAAASEAAGGPSTMKTTPRRPMMKPAAKAAPKSYRDEGSQGIAKMAANPAVVGKPKSVEKVSLEEYSAKSPWNTRGTKEGFSYSKGQSSGPSKPGALDDLMETVRKAPKLMKSGGSVGASKRGDGIATRGKTKGRII